MNTFHKLFCLLLALAASGQLFAAPLVVGEAGDVAYASTADLNAALTGYDSLQKLGDSTTVTLNLTPATLVNTNLINVDAGVLNWNSDNPTASRSSHLFAGTINVASGGTLQLAVKDALGAENNEGNRITLNVAGTLQLGMGTDMNQTLRAFTLNLTGGTVENFGTGTAGKIDYRINATQFNAISGDSTFAANLNIREDVTAPAITVSEGATLNISGVITRSNATTSGAIIKKGAGLLTLSNASAYGSGWVVEAGTLKTSANRVFNATPLEIQTGAVVDLNGTTQVVSQLNGSGLVQNHSTTNSSFVVNTAEGTTSTSTIRIGESTNDGTTYGTISVMKLGTGTWTIKPSATWNIDRFDVEKGVVEFTTDSGQGSRFLTTTFHIGNGGTVFLNAHDALGPSVDQTTTKVLTFNVNEGGTLQAKSGVNQTCRGMTFNLKGGTMEGGEYLLHPNTTLNSLASATTSVVNASLTLRQGDATFTVADGGAAVDLDITAPILMQSDAGALKFIKAGSGFLKFSAQNVYTGLTQVDGGRLLLGVSDAINPNSAGLSLAHGTVFDMNGFDQTLASLASQGHVQNNGTARSTLTIDTDTTPVMYTGNAGANIDIVKKGTGTWTISSTVNWGANSLTIEEGTVSKSGTNGERFLAEINVGPEGTLELAAADTLGSGNGGYAKVVNIAGTLKITRPVTDNQTSRQSTFNLRGGTILGDGLMFVENTSNSLNSLATHLDGTDVTRTSVIDGIITRRGSADFVVTVEDAPVDVDLHWKGGFAHERGATASTSKIVKRGDGVLKLSGNMNTTKGTVVEAGGLVLDGATMATGVTVNPGATFSAVNGSTIDGTLTLNGDYNVVLADLTDVNLTAKNVTFGANADVNFIFDVGDLSSGFSANLVTVDPANQATVYGKLAQFLAADADASYYLNMAQGANGQVFLSVDANAVPEPTSVLLLLFGATFLVWRRIASTRGEF